MPRFVFRLDPVLRYRAQRQEMAEQALAAAQREREERARALEANRRRLAEALRGEARPEAVDLAVALHLQLYRDHLRAREENLARDLAIKEQAVAERLRVLITVRQEKKALENLKEHRRQAFEAAQRSREQKALDEIGMLRALRADIQTSGKEVK